MKSVQEAIREIITQRVLPLVERDGVARVVLPEQITPADCARPVRCKRPCSVRHPGHELGIGLTGKPSYCIDGKTFVFTPGRIMLMPGRTPHGPVQRKTHWRTKNLDLSRPSSIMWLMSYKAGARTQIFRAMDEKIDTREASLPYLILDQHIGRLIACLLEELRSRPPNYADVGRCILMEIMHRCLRATFVAVTLDSPGRRRGRRKSDSKQPPGLVRAAQEFIHFNYHGAINLDDIAESVDSSVNHLGRQFKAATGMTPIQYLLEVRITAAKQLLLTDLKVREVAGLVGIEDPCYFSRVFRSRSGVSPRRYRHTSVRRS